MTKFTVYGSAPAELYDDTPALGSWLEILIRRLREQVESLGHNVTSEVTINGPSFRVTYFDLDGEYHEGPIETRHPNLRMYPCPRCRVTFGPCVLRLPLRIRIRLRHFHPERSPSVLAGYYAWADTDHEVPA